MLYSDLYPKHSIPSSQLRSSKQPEIDSGTDETLKKYKHFSDSTICTLNANEVIESSFVESNDSKSYNETDFDKNAFALLSAFFTVW